MTAPQWVMFQRALGRTSRLYQAIVEAVQTQGLTKDEFARMIVRRPEVWGLFEYLLTVPEFWALDEAHGLGHVEDQDLGPA